MADVIDQAQEQNEVLQRAEIERARSQLSHRQGSKDCLQCGELNDRAHLGYGACKECTDELHSNKPTG